MRKAIFPVLSLLLLGASNLASGVTLTLLTDNTRSSSGTLSFQVFKACTPPSNAPATGCSTFGSTWQLANGVVGSTATWTWDGTTLAATGTFQSTSHLASNPAGSSVISDKTVNLTINTAAMTTTATSYNCIEGSFLAGVGAHGCLNTSTGGDFVNNSSALYNVGGNANCVQRTVLPDDTSTGNPRGLFTAGAVGACDPVDGGYSMYTIVEDSTATGGILRISNGIPIGNCITAGCPAEPASAGTHFMTFAVVPTANNDGPVNVLQEVPQVLNVLANDTGFTNPVTVTVTTQPTKGTTLVTGSPGAQAGISIQYTSNAGQTGTDTFVYRVLDANGTTFSEATVTVNILPFGANDDTASTTRNSAAINIDVGANDVGFAEPVIITITGDPDHPDFPGTATPPDGPVTLANAIISYTPGTSPAGTATYTEIFEYEVTDDDGLTRTAVVTVTVNNSVPSAVGGPLSAISTQGQAPAGRPGTFTAPGTGGNLGNAPAAVTVSVQGTKGNAAVLGSVITYTVTDNEFFSGTNADQFTYLITDNDGETASAVVTVSIANVTPTVAGKTAATSGKQDTTLNASGAFTFGNGSQAQHTLSVQTQALNGTCVPAISGNTIAVAYTPNAGFVGSNSCVIRLVDGEGDGANGTYNFTVTATGGGGGGGVNLPSGSSFDLWSLSLLAGLSWLRRRRLSKPWQIGDNSQR